MRVLHLSTSDTGGGAARAAYRLHSGLRSNGVDSRMLVQNKGSEDSHVYGTEGAIKKINSKIRRQFDKLPLIQYPNRDSETFSPAWTPERRAKQIAKYDPDIVHLHWISGGYIQLETIAEIDVPVVWTLHDMWPFTGGCHYSKSCTKYQKECGSCPHLGSDDLNDLSNSVWKRKRKAWAGLNIIVVSPSQWLAEQARKSSLMSRMRIEVIPNCLDMDSFCPMDRAEGIRHFNLNEEKYYLLFGAAYETPRKGGDLLYEALGQLSGKTDFVGLTFGNVNNKDSESPIPVRHLGKLSEDDLRLLYSTADLTVVPSREDNLPNVAIESMASGTPCATFNVGGLSDIVDHRKTGYLAEPFDTTDLARGIEWIVNSLSDQIELGNQARTTAQRRYSIDLVTQQYCELYDELSLGN
ncbi:glycosyltransferase family 4 protein [Haloarcula argentinensis]|uniref:Glycosyltransferase n=1 Tax=Haloarcula argentinensis TaxID=43776 RepID=A0A847UKD1_HALAR|nr:glycosyltransferase family 4 protein [Haloarcula argentinensis]NLV11951.1 glycosyltransferase [Haloarcula argentinensis]